MNRDTNARQKESISFKRIAFLGFSVLLLLLFLLLGPMDYFNHGYFSESIDLKLAENDMGPPLPIQSDKVHLQFSPIKNHLKGFEVHVRGQNAEDKGVFCVLVEDGAGKEIEYVEIPLEKIPTDSTYKVYLYEKYKKDTNYQLKLFSKNSKSKLSILSIDKDYLGKDILEGTAAVSFAYAKSVFRIGEKILIMLLLLAIWLWLLTKTFPLTAKHKAKIEKTSGLIIMVFLLTWIFINNSIDPNNTRFSTFERNSEALVGGILLVENNDFPPITRTEPSKLGLARLITAMGGHYEYETFARHDENWNKGYSRTQAILSLGKDLFQITEDLLPNAKSVLFSNGDSANIEGYTEIDEYYILRLQPTRIYNPEKHGSIDKIRFILNDGTVSSAGYLRVYPSQYGLQGKVYHFLASFLDKEIQFDALHFLNAFITALVFCLLVLLLARKYNKLMASVFYVVFLLSPWIVNFARNLYWVEFTWFIPMIIGLYCSIHISNKKRRLASYVSAFLSILLKSLCGYEYITSVMLGLIAFLLVDLGIAISKKDKESIKQYFISIFILGILAVAGFFTAILIHANTMGEGDLSAGFQIINHRGFQTRSFGGELNDFHPVLWPSLNASWLGVLRKYFIFSTDVILGFPGRFFPLLCLVPLGFSLYEYKKNRLDLTLLLLYTVFGAVSVSFHIILKPHSYIHPHMNYVLWYMGFVQICLYSLLKGLGNLLRDVMTVKK